MQPTLVPPIEMATRDLNSLIYSEVPTIARLLQVWRPSICPIEPIIKSVPRNADVLDFGCGRGMLLLNLVASGRIKSGVGVEISEELVSQANSAKKQMEQLLEREIDVNFEYRAPEDILDFDRQFDAVLSVDVLHHVPKDIQLEVVNKLMDLVNEGGTFVYKDMCRKPFWRASANRLHDLVVVREWINYFPIEDVQQTINERSDWEEVKVEKYTRLWYGHELAVAKHGVY